MDLIDRSILTKNAKERALVPKDKSLESWIQDAACSIRIDLTHTGWQEEEKLSGIAWHGGLKAIEDLEKDLKREGGKA